MLRIAIIQFPGLNTEYETRREIARAGMRGEFFRWNEPKSKLAAYDGYVIGGGFSYEDRGRAGVIASLDPIMNEIKAQAAKGKPVLGICNGAQILVESGLIPGVDGNKLAMALARNKRVKKIPAEGKIPEKTEILGTGYYNAWTHLKSTTSANACMFTKHFAANEIVRAPVAHAEGRYTTLFPEVIEKLRANGQIALRYCDEQGVITEDFPVNPNGAMFNIAALCNPAGNVMAVMPHLERDAHASEKLFTSMRDSIMERKTQSLKRRVKHIAVPSLKLSPLPQFQKQEKSFELFISLIITDNEAETFQMTLKRLGWDKISVKRMTHIELSYKGKPEFEKLTKKLIQSGILLNTNKEHATAVFPKQKPPFNLKQHHEPITFTILMRERQDFIGMSKLAAIQNRLKLNEVTNVHIGTLWHITIPTKSAAVAENELKKLLATHLFFNPHRQEAVMI